MDQWRHDDLVTETVTVGGHAIDVTHPRSAEDLIDEREYERDERLPYWADLWPSGRVLAQTLGSRDLTGRTVIELGCGVGLPSIAALLAGARVLATDWYEPALDYAARNAERSCPDRQLDTLLVDWADPPAALVGAAPFDLVIGADVLYERRNGQALAKLLPRLVAPDGEVLIADPRRPEARELLDRLDAAGWSQEVEEVAYEGRRDESGPVVRLYTLQPPR